VPDFRALVLAPFDESALVRLRRLGDVTYESWLDTQRIHAPEELGARLREGAYTALIVEADFVFEEVFEAAPTLRFVGICRNALTQADLEAASDRGVPVVHTPGRNTNAVAELTIALMLALARGLVRAHTLVAGGAWRDPALGYRALRGREVAGSVVGVVGFGQIGRALTARALALGASVLAYDPLVPQRDIEALGARAATLEELLARADFVSLHVPEQEATYHLIDDAALAQMRRGAYLINTSAGSAVDPDALVRALAGGRIAGAALDVFEGQPLPLSSPLLHAPNLILTPHIGGATEETVARHSNTIADELERFLAGEPLQHLANPDYQRARAR
jgi:D-3-phosphoglycerate dehydrogenase